MGHSMQFTCPVDGCDYTCTFRLMSGEENTAGVQDRLSILRDEHPNHPAAVDE